MRARILLKSLFFTLIIGFFVMPNFVEAEDQEILRNTCEYTYTYTTSATKNTEGGETKSSKVSINFYGSSGTKDAKLVKVDATIFTFFDEQLDEGNRTYEVKNWNTDYNFEFNFLPSSGNDYNFNSEDEFKNVDQVITMRGDLYINRKIHFDAYVSDTNNFDFSHCPSYIYVANIWQGGIGGPDYNIFITDNMRDGNLYSYKDLLTTYTIDVKNGDYFDPSYYPNKIDSDDCAFSGWLDDQYKLWLNNKGITADYRNCITEPFHNKQFIYYDYGSDGWMDSYYYAVFEARNPVSHYTETIDFNEKIFCENLFVMEEGSVGWILQRILNYIKIFGPIAVILLSAVDFIKAIMSSDEKLIQSVQSKFIIRLIAAIALFLIPFIVQLILNIFLGISNPTCGIQ